jgi:hypothetical protein
VNRRHNPFETKLATSEILLIRALLEIPHIDLSWHTHCSSSLVQFDTLNEPRSNEATIAIPLTTQTMKGDRE